LTRYRYEKYTLKKGWKFEVVDIAQSDVKGYKVHFSYIIVFNKYEEVFGAFPLLFLDY